MTKDKKLKRLNEFINMLNDEKTKVNNRVHGPASNYDLQAGGKWLGNLEDKAESKRGKIISKIDSYNLGIDAIIERIEKVKLLVAGE